MGLFTPRHRKNGVHALGIDDDLSGDLVLASTHADDGTRIVLHKLLHGDTADVLRARSLGELLEPWVERATQHRVRLLIRLHKLLAREVYRHVGLGIEKRYALVLHHTLEGDRVPVDFSPTIFVEYLMQGMGIDAPSCHILRSGILAAFNYKHTLSSFCCHVCRNGTSAARAHNDDVEIALFHSHPYLSLRKDRLAKRVHTLLASPSMSY